jgi:hypothetical protein
MKTALLTSAVLLALALSGPGRAADLVTKAPPPADPVSGKFYVWLDGSYQSQGLPRVDLGFTHLVFPPGGPLNQNAGPVATFKPRADGAGFNGALGYAFRPGILPTYLGSNARIELGGSYVTGLGDAVEFYGSRYCGASGYGRIPARERGAQFLPDLRRRSLSDDHHFANPLRRLAAACASGERFCIWAGDGHAIGEKSSAVSRRTSKRSTRSSTL